MSEIVLKTHGLRKGYGAVRVLEAVDLSVPKGAIYALMGRNGAGKTTAMRTIMGILRADAGEVELLGERTPTLTVRQKREVGYVGQEQYFYGWMTGARLARFVRAFYPSWDDAEFTRLVERFEVPTDRRVSELAVGSRRKLALALALAHRPRLLVLDEPTSGLDPIARRELLGLVQAQAREEGRTTFFSTHRVDEAEDFADRIGVLDRGRIAWEGPLALLLTSVRRAPAGGDALERAEAAGLARLRTERRGDAPWAILEGPPDRWEASGLASEPMDLESIFIAIARREAAHR